MRKSWLFTVALVATAVTFAAGTALATEGAHFMSSSSSVADNGALVVNWDEAGLGNANIDYVLTADATAVYACINNGGRHPRAANKEQREGTVSSGGSFQSRNGRVRATMTAGPLQAPQFQCPSGQTRILAYVSYTNIVLTDTTNNVTENIASVDRCFSSIRGLCP